MLSTRKLISWSNVWVSHRVVPSSTSPVFIIVPKSKRVTDREIWRNKLFELVYGSNGRNRRAALDSRTMERHLWLQRSHREAELEKERRFVNAQEPAWDMSIEYVRVWLRSGKLCWVEKTVWDEEPILWISSAKQKFATSRLFDKGWSSPVIDSRSYQSIASLPFTAPRHLVGTSRQT